MRRSNLIAVLSFPFLGAATCVDLSKLPPIVIHIETPTPSPTPGETPSQTPYPVSPTMTPTPTNTPVPDVRPTSTPTEIPTLVPSARPTSKPCEDCIAAPEPGPTPKSIFHRGKCERGFEQIQGLEHLTPSGFVACSSLSECPRDGHNACPGVGNRPSFAMGYDVLRSGQTIEQVCDAWMIHDAGRGWKDSYARFFHERDGGCVVYTNPDYPGAAWEYNGMAKPKKCQECSETTPTPTNVPTGDIPPQPRDFRLNFVNGCNRLKINENGCGICDSTQRFIGTLSDGSRHGDACDAIIARGPKTQELCQHERWDSVTGIDFWINGEYLAPNTDNPFNRKLCYPAGTQLTVRTCLPPGAKTIDGVVIPGGPGCSEKSFEVTQ